MSMKDVPQLWGGVCPHSRHFLDKRESVLEMQKSELLLQKNGFSKIMVYPRRQGGLRQC